MTTPISPEARAAAERLSCAIAGLTPQMRDKMIEEHIQTAITAATAAKDAELQMLRNHIGELKDERAAMQRHIDELNDAVTQPTKGASDAKQTNP